MEWQKYHQSCPQLYPGKGPRVVLPSRLNRLPLPSSSPPDDVAEPWKGKVESKHQSLLNGSSIQKSEPGGDNLVGKKIDYGAPFRLLKMDGMENDIRDA